ncbi:hypothetical protein FDP41_009358 [Naegleria fowleri]|uniref:CN hydrolase domain-containing protein n=1 Tax=Naegleria fowleri TaxID=5763 RepID=A0A6A5BEH3_NAEFO|nr:uncharacterized protein FDP41_009358 [Naegleria fowleri]KAF0972455.1 hypothetical protein FDP41_009358 [Naegleria fowleri]CAG4709413.1 unnamed protein product [Naegleria fowleri]
MFNPHVSARLSSSSSESGSTKNQVNVVLVHINGLSQDCYKNENTFQNSMNQFLEEAVKKKTITENINANSVHCESEVKDISNINNETSIITNSITNNHGTIKHDAEIIIFPELIGAWLVALNEQPFIFLIPSQLIAMIFIAAANIIQFMRYFIVECFSYFIDLRHLTNLFSFVTWEGLIYRSIYKLKSQAMFEVYDKTFSEIAKQRRAYVVAGSIYLPKIEYNSKMKRLTNDGLYNQCVVYDPFGNIAHVSTKLFPSEDEYHLLTKRNKSVHINANNFCFNAKGLGRVCVLVGTDSWLDECYPWSSYNDDVKFNDDQDLSRVPQFIIVPAFSSPAVDWNRPWQGYPHHSVAMTGSNVQEFAVHQISPTLGELWKACLAHQAQQAPEMAFSQNNSTTKSPSSPYFVSCFCCGKLWSKDVFGESFIKLKQHKNLITCRSCLNFSLEVHTRVTL